MNDEMRLTGQGTLTDAAQASMPDEEAMLLVRAGRVEMLDVLFNRYQGPLFNFFCKMTGDRGSSEDLVQDVFMRILKYRATFRPGSSFRTWMYQIARNARLDRWRKQRPELDAEVDETLTSSDRAPIEHVLQEQEAKLLHAALMQLPVEKRELLMLNRFQGLKYEEIGKMFDLETGTVK